MGAALHALGTEWSAKLGDMYKRANKTLVMKCRYVEKVKLADLWVTMNVKSFNLVEPLLLTEGERQGQGVYSASWGPTLEQITCLRAPNSLSCCRVRQTATEAIFQQKLDPNTHSRFFPPTPELKGIWPIPYHQVYIGQWQLAPRYRGQSPIAGCSIRENVFFTT